MGGMDWIGAFEEYDTRLVILPPRTGTTLGNRQKRSLCISRGGLRFSRFNLEENKASSGEGFNTK